MTLSPRTSTLTSDEVIALCRELTDIVRAGVPLPLGLRSGSAITARLEHLMEQLACRLEAGEDLASAVEGEAKAIPPVLRSIVIAGVRAGRIDELLADLGQTTEQMQRMRHSLFRGLIYPVFVVILASILSLLVLPQLFESYAEIMEGVVPDGLVGFILRNQWIIVNGGWILLAVLGSVTIVNWMVCGAANSPLGMLSTLPLLSAVSREASLARSVHLLMLLAKYRIPLPESFDIVAAATDDIPLRGEFERLADVARTGGEMAIRYPSPLPRFVQWMLMLGYRESRLAETLQEAAAFYHDRALQRAELMARVFPTLVLVVVGGGFTFLYATVVYASVISLWGQLGGAA